MTTTIVILLLLLPFFFLSSSFLLPSFFLPSSFLLASSGFFLLLLVSSSFSFASSCPFSSLSSSSSCRARVFFCAVWVYCQSWFWLVGFSICSNPKLFGERGLARIPDSSAATWTLNIATSLGARGALNYCKYPLSLVNRPPFTTHSQPMRYDRFLVRHSQGAQPWANAKVKCVWKRTET